MNDNLEFANTLRDMLGYVRMMPEKKITVSINRKDLTIILEAALIAAQTNAVVYTKDRS